MSMETIINRQFDIANDQADTIEMPKYRIYAMCNLRGGIGKTTLSFNLSYLVDNLLAVDTCPQGNLSYFYDKDYYAGLYLNNGFRKRSRMQAGTALENGKRNPTVS